MPDKSKTIVKFNIQNVKYATKNGNGWSEPLSMGTSTKISLESNSNQKNIFGDGKIIAAIFNDKGKLVQHCKTIFAKIMKLQGRK